MISRSFRLHAVPILLAAVLLGLAAPMPAQATFTTAASVTMATTSATLQPATLVALPGLPVCLGTVTVTWTPTISFVTGAVTGFIPADISYLVTLKFGIFSSAKTVNGGASASVDFTGLTLLTAYSATVQVLYKGWFTGATASTASRGCIA